MEVPLLNFQMINMLFSCSKELSHKKIRNSGLSDTECLICSYVSQNKNCSQDDVVQALRMNKTTVAKAMLSLEEKGFIQRETDKTDRRKNVLRITENGIDSCAEIMHLHDIWMDRIMSVLTNEEQEQFESCCVKLLCKAEELISEQKRNTEKD